MDWRYNTIWFEQIDRETFIKWDFKIKKALQLNISDIEYAILWHYRHKGASFETLPSLEKLLYLEMNWANVNDFVGIEKFTSLRRLEMHYCTKLESGDGLLKIANTLEYLHINTSKKFQSTNVICKLSNLKVLCLNNCGALENLQFLYDLPKLVDFRFVNTNILDGDLTPLIEHPNIRSVGFLNKRHYNYKDNQIDLKLASKSNEEFEDYVYKDKYFTTKYKIYNQL